MCKGESDGGACGRSESRNNCDCQADDYSIKNLPGRGVSADIRIVSDIRLTNFPCAKENYPTSHLTDIMEIAGRAATTKRTWPNIDGLRDAKVI